ncbi:KGG domain-containing protein [Candidatus Parcubacteria bacterium]|nr:KGG domain-containing protein [Candidatus Parcubacteria bacterium]
MADQNDNRTGRGFAGMDEQKQKEIASKGGKAAHERGTAHEFTSEEARDAGRKGGSSRGGNSGGNEGGEGNR